MSSSTNLEISKVEAVDDRNRFQRVFSLRFPSSELEKGFSDREVKSMLLYSFCFAIFTNLALTLATIKEFHKMERNWERFFLAAGYPLAIILSLLSCSLELYILLKHRNSKKKNILPQRLRIPYLGLLIFRQSVVTCFTTVASPYILGEYSVGFCCCWMVLIGTFVPYRTFSFALMLFPSALLGLSIPSILRIFISKNNSYTVGFYLYILSVSAFFVTLSTVLIITYFREKGRRGVYLTSLRLSDIQKRTRTKVLISKIFTKRLLPAKFIPILSSYLNDSFDTTAPLKYQEIIPNVIFVRIDLINFCTRSRNFSPTKLVKFLDMLYSAYDSLTSRYSFTKMKTEGDSYVAYNSLFGAQRIHFAILFGFELINVLKKKLKNRFEGRIGLCIEKGIFILFSDHQRVRFDVYGKGMQKSEILERSAKSGGICVEKKVRDQVVSNTSTVRFEDQVGVVEDMKICHVFPSEDMFKDLKSEYEETKAQEYRIVIGSKKQKISGGKSSDEKSDESKEKRLFFCCSWKMLFTFFVFHFPKEKKYRNLNFQRVGVKTLLLSLIVFVYLICKAISVYVFFAEDPAIVSYKKLWTWIGIGVSILSFSFFLMLYSVSFLHYYYSEKNKVGVAEEEKDELADFIKRQRELMKARRSRLHSFLNYFRSQKFKNFATFARNLIIYISYVFFVISYLSSETLLSSLGVKVRKLSSHLSPLLLIIFLKESFLGFFGFFPFFIILSGYAFLVSVLGQMESSDEENEGVYRSFLLPLAFASYYYVVSWSGNRSLMKYYSQQFFYEKQISKLEKENSKNQLLIGSIVPQEFINEFLALFRRNTYLVYSVRGCVCFVEIILPKFESDRNDEKMIQNIHLLDDIFNELGLCCFRSDCYKIRVSGTRFICISGELFNESSAIRDSGNSKSSGSFSDSTFLSTSSLSSFSVTKSHLSSARSFSSYSITATSTEESSSLDEEEEELESSVSSGESLEMIYERKVRERKQSSKISYSELKRMNEHHLDLSIDDMKYIQKMTNFALHSKDRLSMLASRGGEERKFDFKIGYSFGFFTAGIIGKRNFIFDILGESVNMASRMCSTAKRNQIQFSNRKVYSYLSSIYSDDELMVLSESVNVKGYGETEVFVLKPDI